MTAIGRIKEILKAGCTGCEQCRLPVLPIILGPALFMEFSDLVCSLPLLG